MAVEVNKVKLGWFIAPLFVLSGAYANDFSPVMPNASISGYIGKDWSVLGDGMIPIFGSPTDFTYVNPQMYYYDGLGEFSGSFGIGQRYLNDNSVWGAYVFADYNHSLNHQDFWFVSPGIEYLSPRWDFHVNAYLPVTKQQFNTGTEFADETGDYQQIRFSGHDQYDEIVNTDESTGYGGDSLISYHLPWRDITLSAGSYLFFPQDHSEIIGGLFKVEVPINHHLSFSASEAYDGTFHNTIRAGITLSFGGHTSEIDSTPIKRQLIAVDGGSHTGEPIVETVKYTQQMALELSNISFFLKENSSTINAENSNGTYENPYQGFSQSNIDDANQKNNKNFYLESGSYNVQYAPDNSQILLNNDQLYGRQDNFSKPAQDENMPILHFSQDGITFSSTDNSDKIMGVMLLGSGNGSGLQIFHTNDTSSLEVNLNNISIKDFNNGIDINNTSKQPLEIKINNSEITNNFTTGITVANQGAGGLNFSMDNSTIENNGDTGLYLVDYQSGNLTATINNSTIDINGNNGIYAINEFNNGTLSLNINSSIIANNISNGIQIYNGTPTYNANTGDIITSIKDSQINNNGSDGILAINSSTGLLTLAIKNSSIDSNAQNGIESLNISDSGNVDFTFDHSQVEYNLADGIRLSNTKNTGSFNFQMKDSVIAVNEKQGLFLYNADNSGNFNATIYNSYISNNGLDGIYAMNDISNGLITLSINQSQITANRGAGIFLDNHSNDEKINASITNSEISDNGTEGIRGLNETEHGQLDLQIKNSIIANNRLDGLVLNQTNYTAETTAEINNSTFNNNGGFALSANHASIFVDNSIISGGKGISTTQNGVISIENPIYFDGDIHNNQGEITFDGVTPPTGSTHAYCVMGTCQFTPSTYTQNN